MDKSWAKDSSWSSKLFNTYNTVTTKFKEGLFDATKDGVNRLLNPVTSTINSLNSTISSGKEFMTDFVNSGSGDLGLFTVNRVYDNISSMSVGDWSYAAGYSAPGLAFGSVGGYALSGIRIGSLSLSLQLPKISFKTIKINSLLYLGNYLKYFHPRLGTGKGFRLGLSVDKGRQVFRGTYGTRKYHYFNIDLGPIPKIKD